MPSTPLALKNLTADPRRVVLASAGVDGSAEILSVQVCDEGGRLVYIIGVLTPEGEAQNLVLGAQ